MTFFQFFLCQFETLFTGGNFKTDPIIQHIKPILVDCLSEFVYNHSRQKTDVFGSFFSETSLKKELQSS